MNCIIVDDEPVARKGMKSLVEQIPQLTLVGSFSLIFRCRELPE